MYKLMAHHYTVMKSEHILIGIFETQKEVLSAKFDYSLEHDKDYSLKFYTTVDTENTSVPVMCEDEITETLKKAERKALELLSGIKIEIYDDSEQLDYLNIEQHTTKDDEIYKSQVLYIISSGAIAQRHQIVRTLYNCLERGYYITIDNKIINEY